MNRRAEQIYTSTKVFARMIVPLCLILGGPAYSQDLEYGTPRAHDELAGVGAVALGPDGTTFVLETLDHRVRFAPSWETGAMPAWSTLGEVADRSEAAALNLPQGIAVDSSGNVFVADTGGNDVKLYRPDGSGGYRLDATFAVDGAPLADSRPLSRPTDILLESDGRIFLLDSGNKRILVAAGPDSRRWEVYRADTGWEAPQGIGIGADGAIYVADTGNHRIVKLPVSGSEESFGQYGARAGLMRSPRDVAVGAEGQLYVADSGNHRIAIFSPDGDLIHSLGEAPLPETPSRVIVSDTGAVLVADPGTGWLVAWPGPESARSLTAGERLWDGYLRLNRDHPGGEEPWPSSYRYAMLPPSPDILVRQRPDISFEIAQRDGLETYASDPVIYGEPSWVYFQVHNRGMAPIPAGVVSLWWKTNDIVWSFPDGFSRQGIFDFWPEEGERVVGNFARLGWVPPAGVDGGSVIAGPLVWIPPPPDAEVGCDNKMSLMARFLHIDDPMPATRDLNQVRLSNNIARRWVPLVRRECIPARDRYERNDRWDNAAVTEELWDHLHERCTEAGIRGDGAPFYPERICTGIFEDGGPPDPATGGLPKTAEEIWNLVIPDLSLHGPSDRDFFRIALPDISDPAYDLDDINPERIRILGMRNPAFYEPMVMPECGTVQREEFGLAATDNQVNVNISTILLITAESTTGENNALTDLALNTDGEKLYIYRDGSREDDSGARGRLVQRIVCPQSREGMLEVDLSFGERFDSEGFIEPRDVLALGGYQLKLSYKTSIRRGTPTWVGDFNDGRGIRDLGCMGLGIGLLPGGVFPFCGASPGLGLIDLLQPHPQTPGLLDCINDGRGCLELSMFDWFESGIPFDLLFSSLTDLGIRLLSFDGQEISSAVPVQGSASMQMFQGQSMGKGSPLPMLQRLEVKNLPSGTYFLEIKGKPAEYSLQYYQPQDLQVPQQKGSNY